MTPEIGEPYRTVRELITGRTVVVENGRFRWTLPAGGLAIFSIE